MIKFALRRNLIYPLQLIIWNLLRKLETILISYLFNFDDSLVYTPLMFFGEFISGLIIYNYQNKFLKKEKKQIKIFSITLRENDSHLTIPDNKSKIFILIFFSAFFDMIQFLIWTANVPKFIGISNSIVSRLSGILTLTNVFFCYFALRLTIFKHQAFSNILISICLIIVIITEFLFQDINIFMTYTDFIIILFIIFFCQILNGLIDSIEKYLYEYDFLNPFYTLMYEGIYGFILSFLIFFVPNFGNDITLVYKNYSTGYLILFTFLLLLYIILCGGRNVYRVITTKLYSPMARSLTDYFLNPIYFIFSYAMGTDFLSNGERNIFYFIVNLILSIVISFCGCVNNEFIVLFCCGLETNTHNQIVLRSNTVTKELEEYGDNFQNLVDEDNE